MVNNELALCITGLRAEKLFGAGYTDKVYSSTVIKQLIAVMVRFLEKNSQIKKVYIGMSSGIDLLFGIAIHKYRERNPNREIDLYCVIPGRNQDRFFTREEKAQYKFIIDKVATTVIRLSDEQINPKLFIERNQYMVDNSDLTLAFWDFNKSRSGTYNTMCYSRKQKQPVYLFDAKDICKKGEWWFPPSKDSGIKINDVHK
jgi:uncharacterized phage-like protein YoqJ